MQSIDRKLARCAREIEAAKPKGLTLAQFELGDHLPAGFGCDFGAEVAPTPARPKVKTGDRFRVVSHFAYLFPINEFKAIKADDWSVWAIDPNDGTESYFLANNVEPIPSADSVK